MRFLAVACSCLILIQHLTGAADAATPLTNRELLELCRVDVAKCRSRAELQGKASLLALKAIEIQTGQCIVEVPETISGKELADVGLFYIEHKAPNEDEDIGVSFSRAFAEQYRCP